MHGDGLHIDGREPEGCGEPGIGWPARGRPEHHSISDDDHSEPGVHPRRWAGADTDELGLRRCPLTGELLPPPDYTEPTDTWSELDHGLAGPPAPPPPPDPDADADHQWTRVRTALLADTTAERRARARRLTATRTAADRRRAATVTQAAAYAAEAAARQARPEADTDHELLAQLDAETLAELDAHMAAGIHDTTRAPDEDLHDAA